MSRTKASAWSGHGLPNIERRVRNLGGSHSFGTGVMGGTLLRLTVPLDTARPALQGTPG